MSLNQVFLCFQKPWKPYSWRGSMSLVTPTSLRGERSRCYCTTHFHYTGANKVAEIETDRHCFFREYCKELKLSLNNTQFLLDFSQYIDRNTPDACESCIFFTRHICTGCDVSLLHCLYSYEYYNTTDLHNVT